MAAISPSRPWSLASWLPGFLASWLPGFLETVDEVDLPLLEAWHLGRVYEKWGTHDARSLNSAAIRLKVSSSELTAIVRSVTSEDDILGLIGQDPDLAELLWHTCEFDLTRGDQGEPVRLSSGRALEGIAGDFTGGTFFLCGERGTNRPVLYASSEGQAGLIGRTLTEALEIMVGLPSWWDCLKFSGDGDLTAMQSAAEHLARDLVGDQPEIGAQRAKIATTLSLDLAPVPVLLARLRDAVAGTTPDFVLTVETGEQYETLFGSFLPSRVPSWCS
ncbi:hypothetical protein OG244_08330 [Streptomyces brevispora]|uniref:hypothetical protein n=1 Tax=Streptomyces brevispora TaxID=887462 RepID=UPI002E359C8D|nr:hypothetical protein [Streptomyces brevispora]